MNSAWKKGLAKGSQELRDVEEAYASSAFIRRRLAALIEELYQSEMKSRVESNEYDSPAWAFKQADAVGYARALKRIQNILLEK